MKQLTDLDIEQMGGGAFAADERAVKNSVRQSLKSRGVLHTPHEHAETPKHAVIDLHNNTVEQAWGRIVTLVESGVRRATVITGASGILKIEFQKWISESILSPRIISCKPINNGSFEIVVGALRTQCAPTTSTRRG